VNDTLLPLENQFTAVYDDIDLITYHGQLAVQPSGKFEMLIDGKYFDFKTFDQPKPWHKPDFEIIVDATYHFGSKFSLGMDFTVTGNRWVRNYSVPEEMTKLKPVADLNLKMNYHYSKLLTFLLISIISPTEVICSGINIPPNDSTFSSACLINCNHNANYPF